MHTIRHIEVYSAARIFATVYLILSVAIGLFRLFTFAFLDSLPTFPVYYSTGNPADMTVEVAIINFLLGIVINTGSAALVGAVLAWIYNQVASYFGGLQIRID